MKAVLESVNALWRKAEREAYRSLHASSKTHKADHFFNFCVTAHSLRDYFFEKGGLHGKAAREPFYNHWAAEPLLVAVAEIANLSKHFQLRDGRTKLAIGARTRRIAHQPTTRVDVHIAATGEISLIPRPARDIVVTTGDGSHHDLWRFQIDVLDYWYLFLRDRGIRVRRQSGEEFMDHPPGL
jgi:hypothetical protein